MPLLSSTLLSFFLFLPSVASAQLVISEVMWMGSDRSTADEWLELTSVSSGPVDLTGWKITSRKSTGEEAVIVEMPAGTLIGPGEALLIGNNDAEASRLSVDPDVISTSMSLPNTKLFLQLTDPSGIVVDAADDGVGAPFAGANPSGGGAKASMERIDLLAPGTLQANWATALTSINFDPGPDIFGTPRVPAGSGAAASSASSSVSSVASDMSSLSSSSVSSDSSVSSQQSSPASSVASDASSVSSSSSASSESSESSPLSSASSSSSDASSSATSLSSSSSDISSIASSLPSSSSSSPSSAPVSSAPSSAGSVSSQISSASSASSESSSCLPVVTNAVLISEMLPDPVDDETLGEWIELQNISNQRIALCGWSIDDIEGGSSPFALDGHVIDAGGFLVLDRSLTKITLNNDTDAVRLFGPTGLREEAVFQGGKEAQSYARKPDGSFAWTADITPGAGNRFIIVSSSSSSVSSSKSSVSSSSKSSVLSSSRSSKASSSSVTPGLYKKEVRISEVYAAPDTARGEGEWIELQNTTDHVVDLSGWILDDDKNPPGKGPKLPAGTSVPVGGYLVLDDDVLKMTLNNGGDDIWLLSPDGSVEINARYPKVKKAQAYAFGLDDAGNCLTDAPTPGTTNRCIAFLPIEDAPDNDHDFLPDDREEYLYRTSPADPDSDDDKWLDGFEVFIGRDPLKPDPSLPSILEEYQEFILSRLRLKHRILKTRGLILSGKGIPGFQMSGSIDGNAISALADGTAGDWEVEWGRGLAAGVHPLDVSVVDPSGRLLALGPVLDIEILDDIVLKTPAVKTVASKTVKAKTTAANVQTRASQRKKENEDSFLVEGPEPGSDASPDGVTTEAVAVGVSVLSSILLVVQSLRFSVMKG